MNNQEFKTLIRTVPNFPKPGIMFRDVTTLLKDKVGFAAMIDNFKERYLKYDIDYIAGIESRGFIIGAGLAYALNKGFIPVRKKGKLPGKTISVNYQLEYGTDTLEIHEDSLPKYSKVLLVDDLLATGGTALGAIELIEKIGAQVIETCFIVDLPELRGGDKLRAKGYNYYHLVDFDGH